MPRFFDRLGVRVVLTILLFLLMLALAMTVLIMAGFERAQQSAVRHSVEALETESARLFLLLAEQKAADSNAMLEQAADAGRVVAGLLATQPCDGAGPCGLLALEGLVPSLLSQLPPGTTLYYTGPAGQVDYYYPGAGQAASLEPAELPLTGPDASPAGDGTGSSRRTAWSEPAPALGRGGPVLTARTPVYRDDAFQGVVAVEVPLETLATQLQAESALPGSSVLVVNDEGVVVAGSAGQTGTLPGWAAGRSTPGLAEIEVDGQTALLAYAPLPEPGWHLGLVAPAEAMTAQAADMADALRRDAVGTLSWVLTAMAIFFLVALAFTVVLSHHELTGPIEALATATRAVAAGDMSGRVAITTGGELGRLGRSFNDMTARLANETAEHRQADESLRESEAKYRSIFEATSDGLTINDLAGQIVEVNPAFVRMHGYTYQELVGAPVDKVLHPDHRALLAECFAAARAGRGLEGQAMNLRRDGTAFHVTVESTPLTYRGRPHLLAVVRDVTERVQAQQMLEQRVADRTRELSALYDVAAVASASLDLATILERSLERVLEVMSCKVGGFYLLDESEQTLHPAAWHGLPPDVLAQMGTLPRDGGLIGWVVSHGEPMVVRDIRENPQLLPFDLATVPHIQGSRAYAGAPVHAKGEILGALSVISRPERQFSAEEVALLASIADQVGVAVENARLYHQAEELAVMRERERLARDLHDSVTQSLYSANLMVETGRRAAEAGDLAEVEHYLRRLGEVNNGALKEMRLLVHELRPPILEGEGLVGALQNRLDAVEGRTGTETRLLVEGHLALPEAVEEALYRIAVEALNNSLKHAGRTAVTVHILALDERVEMEIADNGCGFDPQKMRGGGMGLLTMRQRAERLGGTFGIETTPGQGTVVRVSIASSPAVCEPQPTRPGNDPVGEMRLR